jgi:CHASE2 domain-containing sensor protein
MNFQRNPFLKQGLGAAETPSTISPTTTSSTPMIPASIAQQIFTITASAAGGLVGFILAYKLRHALMVNTAEVSIATGVIIAATFGSLLLFRTTEEFPETPAVVTPVVTPEVTP